LVHAEKYRTEDKLKIQTQYKTKHNPEKANNAKKQQFNKTILVMTFPL